MGPALRTLLLLIIGSSCLAQGREEKFQQFSNQKLSPLFKSAQKISFGGQAGRNINGYYFRQRNAKGAIVISPGWSEPARLYIETIYDLKSLGYSVFIMDHRGQGESERLVDCECSHVESFKYYIEDFGAFFREHVLPKQYAHVYLFGHSMGGAIATLAAADLGPQIEKVILSAPLFKVNTGGIPELAARLMAKVLVGLGYGTRRRPFDDNRPPEFITNRWTQSEVRYNYAKTIGDELQFSKIKYFTTGWLNELFRMTDEILNRSEKLLQQKTLILQPEKEFYVISSMQDTLCEKARDCRIEKFSGSKHSLLFEKDEYRDRALKQIADFLAN